MKKTIIALTTFVLSLSAAQALAAGQEGRKPPPEAFEICEGKSEGDSVSITSPQGDTVEATCKAMRGDELVAVPEGGGRQGGKGKSE